MTDLQRASARRVLSWPSLIREHRMAVAHMADVASGKVQPVDEDEAPATPSRSYSIVSDHRQSGWYDPGMNVMDDATGLLMRDEPMSMRAAEELLSELEEGE